MQQSPRIVLMQRTDQNQQTQQPLQSDPKNNDKENSRDVMLPALIIILLASLSSMIFATLATRPMRMQGYTKQEDIAAGRANLFFFGNFFAMSLQEFESGMDQVLQQDANLESAIKRDLYFLGRSLGRKFQLLRMCYNVFMVGVIIAIIVFAISFCIQLYTNP